MTSHLSPATLAVSAFAVATIGFAGGVAMSTAFARTVDSQPIIDRDAWNETAPAKPVSLTQAAQPRCNPWEISDAAMEDVLDQMIRRGWRPPTQGTAVALLDSQAIQATDPAAPMPMRRVWSASDESAADDATVEDDAADVALEPQPEDGTVKTEPPPV